MITQRRRSFRVASRRRLFREFRLLVIAWSVGRCVVLIPRSHPRFQQLVLGFQIVLEALRDETDEG